MKPNWTTYFAARLETLFAFIPAKVYSNIDPAREYNGEPICEIQEAAPPIFRSFISGRSEVQRSFTVATRAPSDALALEMIRSARALLFDVLKLWEESGDIYGAVFDDLATEPDERGLVTGESFFGYLTFHFTENCGLPQGE